MNNQQKAIQNLKDVQKWIAERDAENDYMEYERSGKINRKALCDELDFSRSVVNQNPAVKALLSETEERWYGVRVKDIKAVKAASERSEKRLTQTAADNSKLLEEIARLKAENGLLKRKLEKYAAMDELIQSTGLVRL